MYARYLATNLLNFFLAVVEGFLALRFVLKLFGANANNNFVSWIYDMSGTLLDPFRGIFPAKVFENRYVFEFSTLFAMLMYALLALILVALIRFLTAPAAAAAVDDDDNTVVTKRRRVVRR